MKKSNQFILGLLCSALLAGCSAGQSSSVIEKDYELGDAVTILPRDLLGDLVSAEEAADMTVDSDLKTSSDYEYSGFKGEVKTAGKDYLEIGTYSAKVSGNGTSYNVTIEVKDTTAPKFIIAPARRTVAAGSTEEEVLKAYKAEDKDEADLSLSGEYDLDTPGEYAVEIVASDPSGNSQSRTVTLTVTGEGDMITSDQTADINPSDYLTPEESETEAEETEPAVPEDSGSSDSVTQPAETPAEPEPETPDSSTDSGTSTPPACSVSGAPAGATIYYSFEEAYAAGVAWNQQNPDNYFYYLQGSDDCGKPVYIVTMGTKSAGDGV